MENQIIQFVSIPIVGVGLSIALYFLKAKYGSLKSNKTKALLVLLSIILGALFFFLWKTPYAETVMLILGNASTFYGLFLNKK